ncbi:hypothetical protein PHAVU_010G146000 [Phaseolus vulgaris]|uniref:Avr9/Cf-9 rapidly elicited protein n=1 Tax=Phaseolus vulgaris TaxID=3885 RepID=V7AQ00_PHAVU|nr:hypothetical protein PHAVU_010G146000g [Phaseolus vulgaris]ESW07634.1 hypothetical protein PHAVU_010G146000g [Phaseolus vulgaris]
MENNSAVIAKRVWKIIRVAFFMLRKGISKGKLMMHLNVMLKRRSKLAGKAITNLIFHHPHHAGVPGNDLQFSAAREYEFSCSNTPNNFFATIGNGSKRHRHNPFFTCAHAPPTFEDDAVTVNAVKGVLEMLNKETAVEAAPAAAVCSSVVRQLIRVTDSPFPLREYEDDKDNQVDKAAEEFIKRFYKDLKKQT